MIGRVYYRNVYPNGQHGSCWRSRLECVRASWPDRLYLIKITLKMKRGDAR